MVKANIRYIMACKLVADDDQALIPVYAAVPEDSESDPTEIARMVREVLGDLPPEAAYELHQYLANSGYSSLAIIVGDGQQGGITFTPCDAEFAGQAHCLVLSAGRPESNNPKVTIAVLTAFLFLVSQGHTPEDIQTDDIAETLEEFEID